MFAVWGPAVGFGIRTLLQDANTPGRLAVPPGRRPVAASIQHLPGSATLLIFAHPRCPCSRSTIGELSLIMTGARAKPDAMVFFYLPAEEKESWAKTDLWQSAAAIPGVRTIGDPGGTAAR